MEVWLSEKIWTVWKGQWPIHCQIQKVQKPRTLRPIGSNECHQDNGRASGACGGLAESEPMEKTHAFGDDPNCEAAHLSPEPGDPGREKNKENNGDWPRWQRGQS